MATKTHCGRKPISPECIIIFLISVLAALLSSMISPSFYLQFQFSTSPFLLLPLFSYVSNYQVAVFELLTGCIHLAEIPAPSWTGICNYRTGPGRRDNIAEDTYLNIQPCFKVRLCQSATLPIALAQLCTFVDVLSSCHLVSEASREGAAEVQLWRLIH